MSKSLTVGMPISSFLPAIGGMEVGLHNIAKRLAAAGHRPIVFAPAGNVRALRNAGQNLHYEVVSFPPKLLTLVNHAPRLALAIFDLYFAWARRRYGIDIWHGTMGYPIGVALAHYGRHGRLPALVRCAGQDIQTDPEIGYGMRLDAHVDSLVRRWLPQIPRLVAITESVAEEYRALGVANERILSIPNGVSLERFRIAAPSARVKIRHRLGFGPATIVFLTVARHHPKKNLAAVVEAAALLEAQNDIADWAVLIVGKGVPELKPLVDSLGIAGRVKLIDEIASSEDRDDIELPSRALVDIYCASDIFVFPSLIETFGIAIVEAMAAGLPVIVSDAPGCRDVVDYGRFGVMVPPRDHLALANAMSRLATDGDERTRQTELSIARSNEYDWDSVVKRYLRAYEQILVAVH